MSIDLPPEVCAALADRAAGSDLTAEQLVVRYLARHVTRFEPRDDWEQRVATAGVPGRVERQDPSASREVPSRS